MQQEKGKKNKVEMSDEIWKDIPGYEGSYQASNYGHIKSLNYRNTNKSEILKTQKNTSGYLRAVIYKDNNQKQTTVHVLVAMAFLGHTPCRYKIVVDHIDNDKTNNNLNNLQLISHRENASKDRKGGSSEYVGVNKHYDKWQSKICIDKSRLFLGTFDTEIEASEYYQDALKAINNGTEIKIKKAEYSSQYVGVYFHKNCKKWISRISIDGFTKYIGVYLSENEAIEANKKAKRELQITNSITIN